MKAFFDAVRPLFGGRLKQHQVEGLNAIVEYGKENGYYRSWLAYALATAQHETANWMQPIREGAQRYGPTYSDASARRAVASIHAKGIISTNYALPDGPFNLSYYGRGLVQITWLVNYEKFTKILRINFVKYPDETLNMQNALDIMFIGMRDGVFTGKKLKSLPKVNAELSDFIKARAMVNGDVRKYGPKIARKAIVYEEALKAIGY